MTCCGKVSASMVSDRALYWGEVGSCDAEVGEVWVFGDAGAEVFLRNDDSVLPDVSKASSQYAVWYLWLLLRFANSDS